jgi:hypothetical protein
MIGSDCSMISSHGMHSMGMEPVVTAAAHTPLLTNSPRSARQAGLTADLNSMLSRAPS